MDWGFWNAIAITAMAALGMWVFNREHEKLRKLRQKKGDNE